MKKPKLKILEKDIQKSILEWLSWQQIFAWRNNSGRLLITDKKYGKRMINVGIKGSPDIIAILKGGIFLGIECKSPKMQLTDDQLLFASRLRKAGGIYILARSIDD